MSPEPGDPLDPGSEPAGDSTPEGTGEPREGSIQSLSTPWKAVMVAVAIVVLLLLGVAMAVVVRLSCVPRVRAVGDQLEPLPAAAPDSVGGWVDRGDSLINMDASAGAPGQQAGFDFWARAVASRITPEADTLPGPERIQALMDTLQIPGEAQQAVGDARLVGITLRPRSAVRARASYLLYLSDHRVQALPLDLGNAQDVRFAAWHDPRRLSVAATGMSVTPYGLRPVLTAWRQEHTRWSAWDSLPPPDSLGTERSEPSLEESPGSAPVFVLRSYPPRGLFEECPTCPHRYVDRIFRMANGRVSWLSDQVEDGPYSAMSGFLEALAHGSNDEAMRLSGGRVFESARDLGLSGSLEERSWRLAPGQQAADTVLTAVRNGADTYRFRMEFDGDHWRVVEMGRNP